jgi:LysM repeat protein
VARPRRWLARVAAPLAFLAAATVAVLLIREGLHQDSPASPGTTTTPAQTQTRTAPPATTTRPRARTTATQAARFHTIQPGDTLLVVAEQYDTTVIELVRLNPGIEPTNLVVGRRIRVG